MPKDAGTDPPKIEQEPVLGEPLLESVEEVPVEPGFEDAPEFELLEPNEAEAAPASAETRPASAETRPAGAATRPAGAATRTGAATRPAGAATRTASAETRIDPARSLGEALAEATKVLERGGPKPAPFGSWNRYVLPLIVAYLMFLTVLWLWPARTKEVREPAPEHPKQGHPEPPRPRTTGVDLWDEAVQAAREKKHSVAVVLFERHLRSTSLSSTERLFAYQQLAIECRLAGQIEESMRYAGLAQAQTIRTWTPEDLLQLAETAYTEGRIVQARRLFARVLLLQGSLPEHMRDRIPVAALRLGDSYSEEANQAEKHK